MPLTSHRGCQTTLFAIGAMFVFLFTRESHAQTITDFDGFISENLLIDADANYFSPASQIGQPQFETDANGHSVKESTGINLGSINLSTTGLLTREGDRLTNGFYSGARLIEKIRDIDAVFHDESYGVIFYSHSPPRITNVSNDLESWHALGLRILQIRDLSNPLPGEELDDEFGLTTHGRAVVEKCIELGIIVDVSHADEAVTLDVAAIAGAASVPFMANHAPAYALRRNGDNRFTRGKTDAELQAIAATGGVVGVMAYGPWIQLGNDLATTADYVAHLKYIVNLIGIDHVALSTDAYLDGQWTPDSQGNPNVSGDGLLDGPMRWKWVIQSLHENHGYSREDLLKIMGKNLYRVYGQVWHGTYEHWKTLKFPDPNSLEALPDKDPDKDTLSNLLEYVCGLNPMKPDLPVSKPLTVSHETGSVAVRFFRDPDFFDIQYLLQKSTDLEDWETAYDSDDPPAGSENNNDGAFMRLQMTARPREFYRLKVVKRTGFLQ